MKVSPREIHGPWDVGWVLDKHMLKSTYLAACADDARKRLRVGVSELRVVRADDVVPGAHRAPAARS